MRKKLFFSLFFLEGRVFPLPFHPHLLASLFQQHEPPKPSRGLRHHHQTSQQQLSRRRVWLRLGSNEPNERTHIYVAQYTHTYVRFFFLLFLCSWVEWREGEKGWMGADCTGRERRGNKSPDTIAFLDEIQTCSQPDRKEGERERERENQATFVRSFVPFHSLLSFRPGSVFLPSQPPSPSPTKPALLAPSTSSPSSSSSSSREWK